MPDDLFDDLGPFKSGLTNSERGKLAHDLTKACHGVAGTYAATVALGDPTNPARLNEARRMFNAMPSLPRRKVIAAFQRLSRD
jgi:hypothetical protein